MATLDKKDRQEVLDNDWMKVEVCAIQFSVLTVSVSVKDCCQPLSLPYGIQGGQCFLCVQKCLDFLD